MDKYQSSIDPTEKSKLLSGMSGSRDPWLLGRFVDPFTLDGKLAFKKPTSNCHGQG